MPCPPSCQHLSTLRETSEGLQGTRFPSCTSEVTERPVPSHELLTYISFPVATGRTVSELTRSYMGTESAQTLFGTPQATRGESRSITSPYCQLVISRSYASMGCFSISSVIIISDQMSNVKRKKASLGRNRTTLEYRRPQCRTPFPVARQWLRRPPEPATQWHREGLERDSQFLSHPL